MFTPYKYVIPHVVCLVAVYDYVMQHSSLECTLGIVDLATTGKSPKASVTTSAVKRFARRVYSDTNFPP